MTIRCIYHGHEPHFPATDQHPQAKRYGPIKWRDQTLWIDAIGAKPTDAEIEAVLNPPAVQLTVAAKLAKVGLTPEELRTALAVR